MSFSSTRSFDVTRQEMRLVQVSGVHKTYKSKQGATPVLNNFSMNVECGTIYSLMGASGAGKTTLVSLLVGIEQPDSGDVNIFGDVSKNQKSRIGFMPQNTALVNEFTIRETFWFYGAIYGLSAEIINMRAKHLSELLELPGGNKLVKNCSGGQQRRVSFAIALIHEPELLILDEPTVGLDPLLREKIWEHLTELTITRNVTVFLTTHYTEEARQSSSIGFLRNGTLVAEDSPRNILWKTGSERLDDAFLALSKKRENFNMHLQFERYDFETSSSSRSDSDTSSSRLFLDHHKRSRMTKPKILNALIRKNFIEVFRNLEIFIAVIVCPLLICLCLHYGLGGKMSGLKIGIVNEETEFYDECMNKTYEAVVNKRLECTFEEASCEFLDALKDSDLKKVFYKSRHEALSFVKSGENIGYIWFKPNFSQSIGSPDFETDQRVAQVFLDRTNLQKISLVEQKLFDAQKMFMERLMTKCGFSKKVGGAVISTEALIGKMDFDFKGSFVPGFIVCGFFALAATITTVGIVSERASGSWDRILVAGVKPRQILTSQLIVGVLMMVLQFIEIFAYIVFAYGSSDLNLSFFVVSGLLLFLSGLCGLMFGLLCSIVMKTILSAYVISQGTIYPVSFISGTMWPMEGMPRGLRFLGEIFPFSAPISTLRRLLAGDMDVYDSRVGFSCLILLLWILLEVCLSFRLIRK